jgi:hypothetical protein
MGAMKTFAEQYSHAMGRDGEIDDTVLGCAQHTLNLLAVCLKEPLSIETIRKQAKDNADPAADYSEPGFVGHVEGVIAITLGEVMMWDIEAFDEHLSMRLTGTVVLRDIVYSLIGVDLTTDTLYWQVEGDPTSILESVGDLP